MLCCPAGRELPVLGGVQVEVPRLGPSGWCPPGGQGGRHWEGLEAEDRCPQEEYMREQIDWREVTFADNQPCINLLSLKPYGILRILDDQCCFPQVCAEYAAWACGTLSPCPHWARVLHSTLLWPPVGGSGHPTWGFKPGVIEAGWGLWRRGFASPWSHRRLPGGGDLGVGPQILIGKHESGMGAPVSGTRESRDRGAGGKAAGSPPFRRVHSGCPY